MLGQSKYGCNNAFIVLCVEATSQHTHRRGKREVQEELNHHILNDHTDYDDHLLSPDQYYKLLEIIDKSPHPPSQ